MGVSDGADRGEGWGVAHRVTEDVRGRYSAAVLAVGVHGSLAHGDDEGEVRLVVVAFKPGIGPRPATRRINGITVDLVVIAADEYLHHARTLTTAWPLVANQYVTTKPT